MCLNSDKNIIHVQKNKWEEKTWFCHLLGKGTVVRITQWGQRFYEGEIKLTCENVLTIR